MNTRVKKGLCVLLVLSLALALVACGGAPVPEQTPEPTATPAATPEPAQAPPPESVAGLRYLFALTFEEILGEPIPQRLLEGGPMYPRVYDHPEYNDVEIVFRSTAARPNHPYSIVAPVGYFFDGAESFTADELRERGIGGLVMLGPNGTIGRAGLMYRFYLPNAEAEATHVTVTVTAIWPGWDSPSPAMAALVPDTTVEMEIAQPEPRPELVVSDDIRDLLGMSHNDIFGEESHTAVGWLQATVYTAVPWEQDMLVGSCCCTRTSNLSIDTVFAPITRVFSGIESFAIADLQGDFGNDFSIGRTDTYAGLIDSVHFEPGWEHATGLYRGSVQIDGLSFRFYWNPEDTHVTHVWIDSV